MTLDVRYGGGSHPTVTLKGCDDYGLISFTTDSDAGVVDNGALAINCVFTDPLRSRFWELCPVTTDAQSLAGITGGYHSTVNDFPILNIPNAAPSTTYEFAFRFL
jgi:hypothetical protein